MNKSNKNEITENLEKLGQELEKIQYDFKLKEINSDKYWIEKLENFEKYHEKSIEYFMEAFSLIRMHDSDQSGHFLLRISKLKQIGKKLSESIKVIIENPSIMNPKDSQKSKWSKEKRDEVFNQNDQCLSHEKKMNIAFREWYEKFSNSN